MADAKEDKAPLIASQKEFVAYEAQFPNTRINALYGLIEFLDVYDDAALIESIRCLTENEQGLRLKIRRINTNEYEQYDSFDTFNFPQTLRFSNITDLQRFLEAEAEKPLPYLDVPLCIFTILRAENRLFLLIAAHHIVSDGYMLSLTASRVREGCEAIRQNQPLPFINHQVLSYARQEMELFGSSRRTRDLSWWRDQYLNWNGLCRLTPDREWNGDPAGGRIKRSVELVL